MTNNVRIVRNHIIDDFLHCRRKHQLKQEGWVALDLNPNLTIGKATHAGLAVWSVTRDEAKAYQAAFQELGGDEELEEVVYALLSGYFIKWKDEEVQNVSMETEFGVQLTEGVEYWLRIDGLVSKGDEFWVKETKTSGWPPAKFWKLYQMDRQTIGYVWASAKKFGVEVKGAMIDVLYKPSSKIPEARYERQDITVTPAMIEDWRNETLQIVHDMQEAEKHQAYYKSRACWAKFNSECEFFQVCPQAIHDPQLAKRVLMNSHKQEELPSG